MTMITPSYLGETIEYSSLHACRSTLEDPTFPLTRSHSPTTLRSVEEVSLQTAQGSVRGTRQYGQF